MPANFLEQLAAEWYMYQGYFVRTNVKFGRRSKGGWNGEIDVLAFQRQTGAVVHVECSASAEPWSNQVNAFQKKFDTAGAHYHVLLGDIEPGLVERVAIAGNNDIAHEIGHGITHLPTPVFIRKTYAILSGKDPMAEAVPETMPLLRAIQFAGWYSTHGVVTDVVPMSDRPPCACGCGRFPKGKNSRYLPGHDTKHRSALAAAGGDG